MSQQAFERLRYKRICELLDILGVANLDRAAHVRRLFSESSEGFEEVVAFLTRLSIVDYDGRSIRLLSDSSAVGPELRRGEIMRRLLAIRNRYRTEMFRFLNRFRVSDGELIYSPSDQNRSAESGVRNFLMDLGLVTYNLGAGTYILGPEYTNIYAFARSNANCTSPILIESITRDRNELGATAEELLVEYEKSRVGPRYAEKVDHVAARNCVAGYDIRSVSIQPNGVILPRFIEVKAVSPVTYQFYWSRNEIDVARALSHWYYLYLLPVDRRGQFNINRLKIVENPCVDVLAKESSWTTQPNALICSLRVRPKD